MPKVPQNRHPRRRRRSRQRAGSRLPMAMFATLLLAVVFLAARGPLTDAFVAVRHVAAGQHFHSRSALPSAAPAAPSGPQALTAPGASFSAGACVEYPPTGPDRHRTVFIDAGHGGPDPGATGSDSAGNPVEEKTLTLATSLAALGLLRQDGFTVVMSRTRDTSVSALGPADFDGQLMTVDAVHKEAQARVSCADAAHADALVSLHFNSGPDASAAGAETIYDDARPFASANRTLAQAIQQDVLAQLHSAGWPVPDRGIVTDSSIDAPALSPQGAAYGHFLVIGPPSPGLIDPASGMPGAILEPLFLTRPSEADVATSATGQLAIAKGMEAALLSFLPSK